MNSRTILVLSLMHALTVVDPGVRRQVDRARPAPEQLSAQQAKRQAKLARRATKKKQYRVRYIGTHFKELQNQTAIAIDDGNTAYLTCQFDDTTLQIPNGDPENIEHHWGFGWHQIPRKDLQRVPLD